MNKNILYFPHISQLKKDFYKSASNLTEEVPKHRGFVVVVFFWIIVYNFF